MRPHGHDVAGLVAVLRHNQLLSHSRRHLTLWDFDPQNAGLVRNISRSLATSVTITACYYSAQEDTFITIEKDGNSCICVYNRANLEPLLKFHGESVRPPRATHLRES